MRPDLHYSFSEGQLVYHCGTRIDLLAKNGLFYLRLEPVRWLQRHTHVIAFQFLGEGRDPCGLVAQRFHVSSIPMIYDSGAFVLVPARKKSLRIALCCFAKHFSLLEPADGTCRRRAYTTLCVTHRFIWFHLMCKLSAQGV